MLVAAINGHSAAYPAGQVAAYVAVALIVIAVVVRSYDSDAPRPAQRQKATLPSRQSSAAVAKTDRVRQTRCPEALPITRKRDCACRIAPPDRIDAVAHRAKRGSVAAVARC